jgi:hypothetical protein
MSIEMTQAGRNAAQVLDAMSESDLRAEYARLDGPAADGEPPAPLERQRALLAAIERKHTADGTRYASAVVVTVAAADSEQALELIERRLHGHGIVVEYARGAVACPAGHDSSSTDWNVPALEWDGRAL